MKLASLALSMLSTTVIVACGSEAVAQEANTLPGRGISAAIAFCPTNKSIGLGKGTIPASTMLEALSNCSAMNPSLATCCRIVIATDASAPCVSLAIDGNSFVVGSGATAKQAAQVAASKTTNAQKGAAATVCAASGGR
jgi:hypothetical protein